jgi:Ni/Co efflux regulator RcnB
MYRLLVTLIAAVAIIGAAADPALAKKGPKFKGPKATKHLEKRALKGRGHGIGGGNVFGSLERDLIRNFLGSPSGKKFKAKKFKKYKHKSLPPGLAKQLRRNGILPPGLRRNYLPPGLSSRLPGLPPGQARVLVGNDVLLIQQTTGLILDILGR